MVCMHLNLSFFVSCCTHPFNVVKQKIFPVFKPNDYFWKHHWDGKEEKGKLYMNTIRKIMMKYGGFKDTHMTAEDRFEYLKAYRGVDDI